MNLAKIKLISCQSCASPNIKFVSDEKYQCQNCNSVHLIQTDSEKSKIAKIQAEFDYQEYENLKNKSGHNLKISLIIYVLIFIMIAVFAFYGLYSHNF
jgi:hypothetical protein